VAANEIVLEFVRIGEVDTLCVRVIEPEGLNVGEPGVNVPV
jgi:hypothetical protein